MTAARSSLLFSSSGQNDSAASPSCILLQHAVVSPLDEKARVTSSKCSKPRAPTMRVSSPSSLSLSSLQPTGPQCSVGCEALALAQNELVSAVVGRQEAATESTSRFAEPLLPTQRGSAYIFPVGRALRLVRRGIDFYRCNDGREELVDWMFHALKANVTPDEDENLSKRHIDSHFSASAASDALLEVASSFAKYHCHHLLIHFKAIQRRCTAALRHPRREAAVPLSAASRFEMIEQLTECVFAASVLLHIGGLYGIAQGHVERLLSICLSCTIFLSQIAREEHRAAAEAAHPTKPTVYDATARRCGHSLHWSIVHFSAGVQLWGLLHHTTSLWNWDRTRLPFERVLQTYAALLCDSTRGSVDISIWQTLLSLKANKDHLSGVLWFSGGNSEVAEWYQSSLHATTSIPPRLQQRRLQLLPLFWLALLLLPGDDPADQRYRTARHALKCLLPLFTDDAGIDASAYAILQRLYFSTSVAPYPSSTAITSAIQRGCSAEGPADLSVTAGSLPSLVEVAALLAQLEGSSMLDDLMTTLPQWRGGALTRCQVGHFNLQTLKVTSTTTELKPQRIRRHYLALLLRRWMDARGPTARHGCPSFVAAMRPTIKNRTVISTSTHLYRAILNIPLCILYIPLESQGPTAGHEQPFYGVTADGAQMAHLLLLRVLLQWRSSGEANAVAVAALQRPLAGRPTRVVHARSQWEREMVMVLKAAHHISNFTAALTEISTKAVLREVSHYGEPLGQSPRRIQSRQKGFIGCEAGEEVRRVLPTVQMVARALAEQLGHTLLPQRLTLLREGQLDLIGTERQLLCSLDVLLRDVIYCDSGGDDERVEVRSSAKGSLMGCLPTKYHCAMRELLDND